MPTYEYRCKECGHNFDVVQSFSDDALTECPSCGGPLRKVFGNVGIAFKGSGFYKTDSRTSGGSSSTKSSASSDSGASSSSDSSSSSGSSSDSGGKTSTAGNGSSSTSSDKSSSSSTGDKAKAAT